MTLARLARKANIRARMAEVEKHTRKRRGRTRTGEAEGRERGRYTHREATGQCWKVALLIRARESERDREEDRGIG